MYIDIVIEAVVLKSERFFAQQFLGTSHKQGIVCVSLCVRTVTCDWTCQLSLDYSHLFVINAGVFLFP